MSIVGHCVSGASRNWAGHCVSGASPVAFPRYALSRRLDSRLRGNDGDGNGYLEGAGKTRMKRMAAKFRQARERVNFAAV